MAYSLRTSILASVAVLAMGLTSAHATEKSGDKPAGKPLKVFILVGQSNMQGKARVHTIERLNMTEDSLRMYKDMIGEDGNLNPVKDAYCVYFTHLRGLPTVSAGPLVPGFGEEIDPQRRQ
ncbi:MAG: hypothetical protein ACOC8H_01890 [bacterium]